MKVTLSEADRIVMTQWATDEFGQSPRDTELSLVALEDGDGETYAVVVRNITKSDTLKPEDKVYQLMWRGSFDSCVKNMFDFGGDLEIETRAYLDKAARDKHLKEHAPEITYADIETDKLYDPDDLDDFQNVLVDHEVAVAAADLYRVLSSPCPIPGAPTWFDVTPKGLYMYLSGLGLTVEAEKVN